MGNSVQGRSHVLSISVDDGSTFLPAAGFQSKQVVRENALGDRTQQSNTGNLREHYYKGFSKVSINGSGVADLRTTDLYAFNLLKAVANSSTPVAYLRFSNGSIGTHEGLFLITGFTTKIEQQGIVKFSIACRNKSDVIFYLGEQEALGDLNFRLGEDATPIRSAFLGAQFGTLTSDISIAIGDTITFSYNAANSNPQTDENCIESSDGVNFFGFATIGLANFVGYTATIDGVTLNNTDSMPHYTASKYPVGGSRRDVEIVLTATVATDIRFIGTANISLPIYNVLIDTVGQSWFYPIDVIGVNQPDSNGSGNDLVFNTNTFMVDAPVMLNTGNDINNICPYLVVESQNFNFSTNNFIYGAPSLRSDGTGKSLDTNGSTHYFGSIAGANIFLPYINGFTVESTCRYIGAVNSNGRQCGIISATSNSFQESLWALGFDDFDGSAGGSGVVVPNFTMIQRNTFYHQSTDSANSIADIRSAAAISGNIYHLAASIWLSDNTARFWVNGILINVVQLTQQQMDDWLYGSGAEFGIEDVKNAVFTTRINIGARLANGAWRAAQDAHIQDFKIHLFEADTPFIENQARFANFT